MAFEYAFMPETMRKKFKFTHESYNDVIKMKKANQLMQNILSTKIY